MAFACNHEHTQVKSSDSSTKKLKSPTVITNQKLHQEEFSKLGMFTFWNQAVHISGQRNFYPCLDNTQAGIVHPEMFWLAKLHLG